MVKIYTKYLFIETISISISIEILYILKILDGSHIPVEFI